MTSPTPDSAIRTPEEAIAKSILDECIEYWTFNHLPEGNRQEVIQIIAKALKTQSEKNENENCYASQAAKDISNKIMNEWLKPVMHEPPILDRINQIVADAIRAERATRPVPSKSSMNIREIKPYAEMTAIEFAKYVYDDIIDKPYWTSIKTLEKFIESYLEKATLAERARIREALPSVCEMWAKAMEIQKSDIPLKGPSEDVKVYRQWLLDRIGVGEREGT